MLKSKKGNVLLEIPIVIGIIAILMVMSYETIVKANKAYKIRRDSRNETIIFKGIVGELRYNSNYEDVKNKIHNLNTIYINKDNLNLDKIKENNILDLMQSDLKDREKFVAIKVDKDLDIISLEIYFVSKDLQNLQLEDKIYLSESLKL